MPRISHLHHATGYRWRALLLALLSSTALAQQPVSEYGMKAVLFFRLSQFVYWPNQNGVPKPTVFCVAGDDNPFGDALAQIDKGNPTVEMRTTSGDLAGCHLLFIPRAEAAALPGWLGRAANRPVLTVSDITGFARSGGMVELPLEGSHISIVVNRRAALARGFEFNAQLLRLARVVEP